MAVLTIVTVGLLSAIGTGGGGGGSDVGDAIDETLSTPTHWAADAGDLNADGFVDIVSVSNTYDPERIHVNIFFQDGASVRAFTPKVQYLVGTQPSLRSRNVAIEDLNLDGSPDIVLSHDGRVTPPGDSVSVLLQDPSSTGQFLPESSFIVGQRPSHLSFGDLDQDGLPDIVVATADGVFLLFQDGANVGQFRAAESISSPYSVAVDVCDLNGDGLPDIVFDESENVRILFNEPTNAGRFTTGPLLPQPNFLEDLQCLDLNGDDASDLVAAISGASTNPNRGSVTVTLQDSSKAGAFSLAVEYVVEEAFTVSSVAVADVSEDGNPDIVCAVQSAPGSNAKVAVLQQAAGGRGIFGAPTFYSHDGVNDPAMVIVAQLGPDNLPDLVLANAYDGIYVYYQDSSGGGAFSTATNIGD